MAKQHLRLNWLGIVSTYLAIIHEMVDSFKNTAILLSIESSFIH